MRTGNVFRIAFHVTLLTIFFVLPAFSQQRWERTYGDTGYDYGSSVQQTLDGGYIIAGRTYSFGNSNQAYLIKTNASGDTLWTRCYGGGDNEYGNSVQQTTDGGYIIAGFTGNFWPTTRGYVYLIKTNSSGDTLWTKTYGGTGLNEGYSVQQTTDGGYIIAGRTGSSGAGLQVYLIKTNASGDSLWTRTYGGTLEDQGYSVQQTNDGGYIVAGVTRSFGAIGLDVYLIKTNASGDTLWTRIWGGGNDDYGNSIQQTTDGGYIVAGTTYYWTDGLSSAVFLIKMDASGNTLWTRIYGGASWEYGQSVQQTTDGGYIISGSTFSYGAGCSAVYLIKTNASGDTLWTRNYGGASYDYGYSVRQTSDGGYIIAGNTDSYGAGYDDVYLIKTDANGNAGGGGPGGGGGLKAVPNPFVSYAWVPGHLGEKFKVYDVMGRMVGTYRGDRIGEGLGAGVYFLTPEGRDSRPIRIVKVR